MSVSVCYDFGQTWSGIRTAVTSPTCHMRCRGDARGRGIRKHKHGHEGKASVHVLGRWRRLEDVGCWPRGKRLTRRLPLTLMSTHVHALHPLLKPLLEHLSHILWGHVVNTVSTSEHYCCRMQSLSHSPPTESISVLITYWWRSLFIKVLPVACGAKAFFNVPSPLTLYISKQQLPSSVFGLKGETLMAIWGLLFHYRGKCCFVSL